MVRRLELCANPLYMLECGMAIGKLGWTEDFEKSGKRLKKKIRYKGKEFDVTISGFACTNHGVLSSIDYLTVSVTDGISETTYDLGKRNITYASGARNGILPRKVIKDEINRLPFE